MRLHAVAFRAVCCKLLPLCCCHHGFRVKAVFGDTKTVQGSCRFCGCAANRGGGRLKVLEQAHALRLVPLAPCCPIGSRAVQHWWVQPHRAR